MSERKKWIRIFLNIIIPLGGIGLILWLLPKTLIFFMPFVIGGMIAWIANPLVRFLEHKIRMKRKFGTVLIIGGAIGLVVGCGYFLISGIAKVLYSFGKELPKIIEKASGELESILVRLEVFLNSNPRTSADWNLSETIGNFSDSVIKTLSDLAGKIGAPTVTAAGNLAKSIPNVIVVVFVTILSSYFFIAEKEMVVSVYRSVMPKKTQEVMELLAKKVKHLTGGYFMAQFRIMCVVAVMLFIGLLILRIPYSGVWAVLIAMLDFLPVFGTGTVLIPWALIMLFTGKFYMAVGLAACWLLTQAVRQMIQPKIVGDTMGADPLMTLLFLYLGYRISGLGGMILAVPVGMLVIELYHFGCFDSLLGGIADLVKLIQEARGETPSFPKKEEKRTETMSSSEEMRDSQEKTSL